MADGGDGLAYLLARGEDLKRALAEAGGLTVIDRFLAARRDLDRTDRELLRGWRDDAVRGVFEVQAAGSALITTANLVDDLEYRVYSEPSVQVSAGMFLVGTLLPVTAGPGAWLVSGAETAYPASAARQAARTAIEMATREPELVFRNPEKIKQGWEHMRKDREEFLAFFGADELVFPTAQAEGRLNAYYRRRRDALLAARGRHRQVSDSGETTFVMPPGFFEFATVGIIYDETDGFIVVPEYGMLRDMFANPALAADREHADVLRAYLREDSIPPLPLRRMAAAYPQSADAVFRRVLGNRNFTWRQHGEGLLRKRKPDHYESDPLPGVAVLGDRVLELARRLGTPGWRPVRVEFKKRVKQCEVAVRCQSPWRGLTVETRPGDRRVEQFVGRPGQARRAPSRPNR